MSRKAGVPNKNKQFLLNRLKASIFAWDKVAAYTQPTLKAVILHDEDDWLSRLGL